MAIASRLEQDLYPTDWWWEESIERMLTQEEEKAGQLAQES